MMMFKEDDLSSDVCGAAVRMARRVHGGHGGAMSQRALASGAVRERCFVMVEETILRIDCPVIITHVRGVAVRALMNFEQCTVRRA